MFLKFVGLIGLAVFILLAWTLSPYKRLFPWRTVLWGLGLQFILASLLLKTAWGAAVFEAASNAITRLIQFSMEGCAFVFGPLAQETSLQRVFPERAIILAILITGTIILVASLSSLLYHWGWLQKVVRGIAFVMRRTMGTSGSETLVTAANIFMGQTEAPLLIRPYVARMTRSELLVLMTGGMATIAGGVGAVYAKLGIDAGFPQMPGHLLTASVLSAPAALLVAKVMLPETEASETACASLHDVPRTSANSIDALCRGASEGLTLALNVIAMLIAFTAIVALANFLFIWPQRALGVQEPFSLQAVLGWINAPFAFLMGVAPQDCLSVGKCLGERVVLNEFVGYVSLTSEASQLAPRSFLLASYALCGFANFGSIAIQVGGIGSLVPERRVDLARLGLRSMIGGLLASYITASIAGLFL